MKNYIIRHIQVLFATLGNLFRAPISTVMNASVIGITLAIPMVCLNLLDSAESLNRSWDSKPQVNLYLEADLDESDVSAIIHELEYTAGLEKAEVISKEQALEEFKRLSGLQEELSSLDENPLPVTIIALPTEAFSTPDGLQQLEASLKKIDGIADISMNIEWIKRFNAILTFMRSLALIIGLLLAIAIVLVTSNTVRLLIMDRKKEIIITKLVGGTNTFVRRPFLYFGVILGLAGGLLASLIHIVTHYALNQPIQQLAESYNSQFSLATLSLQQFGWTLLTGAILGWLAARISIARHLSKIKPS